MVPCDGFAPDLLGVQQAAAIGDVVAQDGEVGGEQGPVFRGGGVGEFEAVGAVVERDVEGEGLVEVAEEGRVGGGVWGGDAAGEAAGAC